MSRGDLTDAQWARLQPLLPPQRPAKGSKGGRPAEDQRRIINGMLWIDRTGAPWRDLPELFGKWSDRIRWRYGAPGPSLPGKDSGSSRDGLEVAQAPNRVLHHNPLPRELPVEDHIRCQVRLARGLRRGVRPCKCNLATPT